ncbi:hypothetical protein MRS44_005028 [Fusarium solani]|uniref:uncharacterized protein n=1 Tax=Fusarium solani TaxID=169388 RepID=UPI0032C4AC9B|nr:hypothetical protein MRS44_005028 [Fusarium solani]
MMVQDYDSGLMTPMMPIIKASQLNATVVCLMLLDYILLIVVPLFFMLGACICNDPVYPSYVFNFPRPIHPAQKAHERDLYRALALFWPTGLVYAWLAVRQVCRDQKGELMAQLPPVFLGLCICFITYRISFLKIDSNEQQLVLLDDNDLASDRKEAATVGRRGLGG